MLTLARQSRLPGKALFVRTRLIADEKGISTSPVGSLRRRRMCARNVTVALECFDVEVEVRIELHDWLRLVKLQS